MMSGPLVLVVEDDVELRLFYKQALAEEGFRIDEAHNGFQALEKALQEVPDLIVTDIAVPGIDGIELCRRLRTNAATREIPVLAVTGYGDRHYRLVVEARRLVAESARARTPSSRELP